jgi:hypothetical protein
MVVGDLVAQARFDEAEAAAAAAVELGQSVGDADAWNYYAAHLALIRYFQGRHAELADFADEAAASPAMTPSERAMATTAAVFALAGGRRGPGETMVAAHRASPEPASYQASTWLVAMFALAQLSDGLGDAELGAEVVDRLTPFRGMSVHLSIAIATLGPVDWPLGVASAAAGRLEAGESAVRAAVIDAERTGHRPAMVLAMADLARICARRPDGVAEAVALLDRALELATQYGMTGWVERWQPDAARLRSLVSTEAAPTVRFERVDGSMWSCRYGDRVDVFPDSVGIRHLAVLCASPDTDVSAARCSTTRPSTRCEIAPPSCAGDSTRATDPVRSSRTSSTRSPSTSWRGWGSATVDDSAMPANAPARRFARRSPAPSNGSSARLPTWRTTCGNVSQQVISVATRHGPDPERHASSRVPHHGTPPSRLVRR